MTGERIDWVRATTGTWHAFIASLWPERARSVCGLHSLGDCQEIETWPDGHACLRCQSALRRRMDHMYAGLTRHRRREARRHANEVRDGLRAMIPAAVFEWQPARVVTDAAEERWAGELLAWETSLSPATELYDAERELVSAWRAAVMSYDSVQRDPP